MTLASLVPVAVINTSPVVPTTAPWPTLACTVRVSVAVDDAELPETRPMPTLVSSTDGVLEAAASSSKERAFRMAPSPTTARVAPAVDASTLTMVMPTRPALTPVLLAVALSVLLARASTVAPVSRMRAVLPIDASTPASLVTSAAGETPAPAKSPIAIASASASAVLVPVARSLTRLACVTRPSMRACVAPPTLADSAEAEIPTMPPEPMPDSPFAMLTPVASMTTPPGISIKAPEPTAASTSA